ncbi:hypothetical protein M4B58_00475 [Klebsiella pneumoniae]|nr:hypothetical protein [Klebsiella pneumoniae]
MTKSTITRERLQEIAEDGFLKHGEIKELARMALAAMDSEPVFTLEVARADYKGQKLGNHFGFITLDAARELKEGNYQLYTAQPAPVVPDEVTAEDCPAFVKYDVTEVDEAWARGFNSCRAAMLQAGNSPAQSDCCPAQNRVNPAQGGKSLVIPDEMTSEQAYEIGDYHGDPVDVFARGANGCASILSTPH